jgi:hypothetical protein
VRVSQGCAGFHHDERQPARDQGDHHLVAGGARLTGHDRQHREVVAARRQLPWRLASVLVEHAERRRPGDRLGAAVHAQLRVDTALEVLHREGTDSQRDRDLRDAVPGTQHEHELEFPVGQAALADVGGRHAAPP